MSNKSVGLNRLSLNVTGTCTACGKKSDCKCDRCGDFYCSEECQRKDWAGHRYICFPMPKLVKVEQCSIIKKDQPQQADKIQNISYIEYQIPNGSCVFLVAFKSLNVCFIRSTNPSAIAEHQKILNEVNKFGIKSSAVSETLKIGSHALAFRNGNWCRVQIVQRVDNNSFRVSFTDFGDYGTKPVGELRKSVASVKNLPCHIKMVKLKGTSDIHARRNLRNSLDKMYANKEYKIEYVEPTKMDGNVELFMWGKKILLNSLIQEYITKFKDNNDVDHQSVASSSAETPKIQLTEKKNESHKQNNSNAGATFNEKNDDNKIHSKPSNNVCDQTKNISNGLPTVIPKSNNSVPRQIQMQTPCLTPPFKVIPINENDQGSNILIMDNSYIENGLIGCLLEKYCENLKSVTKFLNEVKVADEPYKPKFAEYCLAKFDNIWYRAKVIEIISEDEFLVAYIDFTNEKQLSSEFIRRYPLSLDVPCCTTLCGIDGLPNNLSEELKKFLEENLTSFSVLSIDTIRMEDNICYLKSNELLNKLRDFKLL